MIELIPISPANAMTFKAIRLAALLDTPTAFASVYADEALLSDEEWLQRSTERSDGEFSIGYLAMDDQAACGIVGGYFPDDRPRVYLVSMWVPPSHRRRGIARRLIEAVVAWAGSRGAREVMLEVTTTNEPAMRLYENMGFVRTGKVVPYPNDPALQEYEMVKEIG